MPFTASAWDRNEMASCSRKVFVICGFHSEGVCRSVCRPKIEFIPNFPPCQLLSTNGVVAPPLCDHFIQLVKIDEFAIDTRVEVDIDP